MIIYLSGPMTGRPDWGVPAFHAAAEELRALGHLVMNPAENFGGVIEPARRAQYMRFDIQALMQADAVALLPGWEQSDGAKLEVAVANEVGIPLYKWQDIEAHAVEPPYRVAIDLCPREEATFV